MLFRSGKNGVRSVVPVLVDVEAAGPCPCMEPRDGFLDLMSFLYMRFISLKINEKVTINVKENEHSIT